jgi:hypothetical protein
MSGGADQGSHSTASFGISVLGCAATVSVTNLPLHIIIQTETTFHFHSIRFRSLLRNLQEKYPSPEARPCEYGNGPSSSI